MYGEIMIKIINLNQTPPNVEEIKYSYTFFMKYLNKYFGENSITEVNNNKKIADILAENRENLFLFRNDQETWLPPFSFKIVNFWITKLNYFNTPFILLPVLNLTDNMDQAANIDFVYHNIRGALEVASHIETKYQEYTTSDQIDSSVFIVNRSLLEKKQTCTIDEFITEINSSNVEKIVLKNWFVHKMGNYYSATREDLLNFIQPNAKKIVDVGAGGGLLGKIIKKNYPDIETYAVEPNKVMADSLKKYYDHVFSCKIEELDIKEKFDAIIMGDVIEHIYNPELTLKKIHSLLNDRGLLIASTPNIGHWSIVKDIIDGRFEYIPFGLLCISHIRFFTYEDLIILMENCGFQIKTLERDKPLPSPEGEKFINHIIQGSFGSREELETAEFRFTAEKL